MYIDVDRLRKDLVNYYGTAWQAGMPMAVVSIGRVEAADDDEVVRIAIRNRFDLKKYEVNS